MTTLTVVPDFDVLKDGAACSCPCGPLARIEQLRSESGKETFRHGVVITVGSATHAGSHLVSSQQFSIVERRILNSAIRMMHHPFSRTGPSEGHPQSRHTQVDLERVTHRPPDDHPAAQIQQDRQIQPAFASANVGNITTPGAVEAARFLYSEAPAQHIFSYSIFMFRVRGQRPIATFCLGPQARFTHQPSNSIPAAGSPRSPQFAVDPRTAVCSPTGFINGSNNHSQTLIFCGPRTGGSSLCGIETGATNLQHPAHQHHRKFLTMNSNAGVLHDRSFAKYAAAFFRKSRSCSRRSTSRRKRRSSSSWPLALPAPMKTFFRARGKPATCRFQLRSMSARIPSRPATALTDSWPSLTSRTASNLNSRVNRRRFPPMNTSFPNSIVRAYLSVHETGERAQRSHREPQRGSANAPRCIFQQPAKRAGLI